MQTSIDGSPRARREWFSKGRANPQYSARNVLTSTRCHIPDGVGDRHHIAVLAHDLLDWREPHRRLDMLKSINFVVAVLAATAANAAPLPLEDLDVLDARIAVFLGGTTTEAGKRAEPVDRRLRMVRCPEGALFEPAQMGAITAYCPSKGWRLRVPLIGGGGAAQPAEIVVRRGDTVELAYAGQGFDVTTRATAIEDGRAGGVVRVKTPTGTGPVTARVRGPGAVAFDD
jgi:flagellar basal body P-ring formation protein FlgA